MSGSHHINRRDFIKLATAAVGSLITVVIGLPVIGYLLHPALRSEEAEAWIPLGPLENFEIGVPTLVNFTRTRVNGWERTANSYGVYIVRTSDSDVIAFSNRCTHLGCRVNWNDEIGGYLCPCHDAVFGPDGGIVRGPQPRPLDRYTGDDLKIEDGIVMIFFTEG
ncbi:MAG: ubiquinol-cytochrome c reductase iron-sulfur subunit [Anaerolineales bacterium]|nr:ubiquinol-cytochrome c reductase iron-sulfur subunit [Anaerolineales bacterium]